MKIQFLTSYSLKKVTCFFLFLSMTGWLGAQCPATSITLTTQAQVDAFTTTYPSCTNLTGSLTIGPSTDIVDLDGLTGITKIDGLLRISDNTNLVDADGLSNLNYIGSTIDIRNNPDLAALDLNDVSSTNLVDILVDNNGSLTIFNAPNFITSTSSYIIIEDNPSLSTLTGFDALQTIGADLRIDNTIAVDFPDFPNLTFIGRTIVFRDNTNVTDIDLHNVSSSNLIDIHVTGNSSLSSFAAPNNITSTSSYIIIEDNPSLSTLTGFDALQTIGADLRIDNTIAVDFPDFPNLTFIGRTIVFRDNTNVTDIDLHNVSSSNLIDILVTGNTSLSSFAAPNNITSTSSYIIIEDNPSLSTLTGFDALQTIGADLRIDNTIAVDFPDFPNLTFIGRTIVFRDNTNVTDIDLHNVSSSNLIDILVTGNTSLSSFAAPNNITSTSSYIIIEDNPSLSTLTGFDALQTIGADLRIDNTIAVDFPDFPNLTFIGRTIVFRDNTNVTDIDLHNVSSSNLIDILVTGNTSLSSFAAPNNITSTSSYIQIYDNQSLSSISGFGALQSVGSVLRIDNTVANSFPVFSNLTSISIGLTLQNNSGITDLNWLPAIVNLGTQLIIKNNAQLSYCAIQPVCDFLDGNGTKIIFGNTGCCETEQILSDACSHGGSGDQEICDGIDNNCDGLIDEGFDEDGDGFTTCQGDCDDTNATINPDAIEVCDGIDNNCDGVTDQPFTIYATIGNTLITLDPITGDATEVAIISPGFTGLAGLTYHPGYEKLFAIINYYLSDPTLVTIDRQTGALTVIGEVFQPSPYVDFLVMESLEYNPADGLLYAAGSPSYPYNVSKYIMTVDPTSGEASIISSISGTCENDGDAFAFTTSGQYMLDGCTPTDQRIYTIDLASGNATLIGSNSSPRVGAQMTMNPFTNMLYAIRHPERELWTISTVDASPAFIGQTHDASEFGGSLVRGIAFAPVPWPEEICDGLDNNCDGDIDEGFDQDNDGVADCLDNCPNEPNPSQDDEDCDGVGDVCDQWPGCDDSLDSDNDGIPNCIDPDEMDNWPCGNNGNKVTICHIPPGNPANRHDICISSSAVPNHLSNHGDYIGECDQIYCNSNSNNMITPPGGATAYQLWSEGFEIYPNPATDQLNIDLHNYIRQEIWISIYNHLGQQVLHMQEQELHNPVLSIELNHLQFPDGIYILSVSTEDGRQAKQFVLQQ